MDTTTLLIIIIVLLKNLHTLRGGKLSRIEPEMSGEFLIQPN